MKKNVALIVRGMGLAMAILTSLMEAIRRLGGEDEDIHILSTPDGAGLLEQIAQLIVDCGKKARNASKLTVDYSRSLAEAIKAGKYDWMNSNITLNNFPYEGGGICADVSVELLHFGKTMHTEDVLAEIKKKGYRPANIMELLALGSAQPELQRQFPIVSFGSVWSGPFGRRCVPYLCRVGAGRFLSLFYLECVWDGSCRFAVVRELS